ncbi:hypothetical protein BT69DRAFT_1305862 [Atractiella rhizophila]|nr:hypothetical protein BT69DRAFT_1305862 [Atractiella rhizophila]
MKPTTLRLVVPLCKAAFVVTCNGWRREERCHHKLVPTPYLSSSNARLEDEGYAYSQVGARRRTRGASPSGSHVADNLLLERASVGSSVESWIVVAGIVMRMVVVKERAESQREGEKLDKAKA